jgi:hypothetical protein
MPPLRAGTRERCPVMSPMRERSRFSRQGSPESGEFEEAEILKTFGKYRTTFASPHDAVKRRVDGEQD